MDDRFWPWLAGQVLKMFQHVPAWLVSGYSRASAQRAVWSTVRGGIPPTGSGLTLFFAAGGSRARRPAPVVLARRALSLSLSHSLYLSLSLSLPLYHVPLSMSLSLSLSLVSLSHLSLSSRSSFISHLALSCLFLPLAAGGPRAMGAAPVVLARRALSLSPPLALSLSLSLTHTHTHTHLLPSLSLSLTHTHISFPLSLSSLIKRMSLSLRWGPNWGGYSSGAGTPSPLSAPLPNVSSRSWRQLPRSRPQRGRESV